MQRFTIAEFRELCGGISYNGADKKIDSLIKQVDQGKLNGEIHRENEIIDGSMTKVVYISDDLISQIASPRYSSEMNSVKSNEIHLNGLESTKVNSGSSESETVKFLAEQLASSNDKLVEASFHAGQAKLLTDNLQQKEQDLKFYQDEYFKMKHQAETKYSEINQLKELNLSKIKLISVATMILLIAAITGFSLYINKLQNPTIVEKTVVKEVIKTVPAKPVPAKQPIKRRR